MLNNNLGRILICRQSEDEKWNVDLGSSVAGNCTAEGLLKDIQRDIEIQNKKEWGHYLSSAHGYRYEDGEIDQPEEEWKIAETCDRWELIRYEAYPGNSQTFEAIVLLYYRPAALHAASPHDQASLAGSASASREVAEACS